MNYKEKRPWGEFENLLEENFCKVKKIIIKPGQSPSYQYHFKREECWVIVQGVGELNLHGDILKVKYGDVIRVSKTIKHQIKNIGTEDLIFIEIQTGEYFGEDDIVRIEDAYGRK